jgi:hypothetical protein
MLRQQKYLPVVRSRWQIFVRREPKTVDQTALAQEEFLSI